MREINQYTLDGVYVKTWDCIRNITRECGYSNSVISSCCSGRYKTSYNFQWKYADECDGTKNISKVEVKTKPKGYWTRERCYEAALDCKTRTEFQKKHNGAYNVALRNGWMDDYTWFERQPNFVVDKIHCVYGYFFDELHTVYIGRTKDAVSRDWQHRNTDCPVRRFADKNNVQVPNMLIIVKELTRDESLILEDLYVEKYRNEGWNLINTAKTGLGSGSIGSVCTKWNKKTCLEAALKCETRYEFQHNFSAAYQVARKRGWLKDYTHFKEIRKPKGYWNYENCFNEALNYNSRLEFARGNQRAYEVALKNGWLDNYGWFIDPSESYRKVHEKQKNSSDRSKRVLQIDKKTHEVIREWPSTKEIERELGFANQSIGSCCLGKKNHKTAYGFIWRYADEDTKKAA